jgi:hypothetical protein
MSLLEDLREADRARNLQHTGLCPLCEYLKTIEDPETKQELIEAAAGKIGRDKLAAILRKYNTGVGQKTIRRHRTEGHAL